VIRTGSLYRFLGQLLDGGLIREVEPPRSTTAADERRRYYGITTAGREALAAEVARMKRIALAAESMSRRGLV
jgi:DNA-binding PadR family transcriptional regulator